MKRTHNEAIRLLAQGYERQAYETAMMDEGIDPNTTFDQWLAYAYQTQAYREAMQRQSRKLFGNML